MQRSELDKIYSLCNTLTRKQMVDKISSYEQLDQSNKGEPMKYIDQYTGKLKNEICITRDKCPLCSSKKYEFLFIKHGFDHMLCNTCELIFTLQIMDTNKIKFLEEGKEGNTYGNYKMNRVTNDLDRKKYEFIFNQLQKYREIKTIFDFGSQVGTFLDWASEKFEIVGHEYHKPIRELAQEKGHTVFSDELETIQLDKEFDLITCWDYLDHVLHPHEVIMNLSKYLKKGGLFFFAINNKDSLSARIMHSYSPMFIGPHHTMHYGIKQLQRLMEGYELLHVESYVSELNWLSNWLNFKNPEFGDSALMTEFLDSEKICELGMGIKLNAIFKKL